ncbi:transposable element Tcb1 transposase [Trichonephila clavipes]|uniref:Transposable element Tcb1 transposase n=1 Tax=Trichonephila clavipes TaxID=2585209 RepID=A0A8X6SA70_TRICX|nr:transposable element Tcb1 transposase [Trichonephila clavipes]
MRICDRWMQESTTDRRGRLHPPQCTTSREDRQIVRMAVTDRSVTSRTVAQHSESVTHHSMSARTIRRHLQQSGLSARYQLLGLPMTQNHRRFHRQWCDERKMWAAEWRVNGVKLSLLSSHASVCNTTMVGLEIGDTMEKGC